MTGQTNEAQWYIARDGKQHGPLTEIEMRTFVGHNYLRPSDLLWRPGMADWQPAPSLFPQVFQQSAAPQPTQVQPAQAAAQPAQAAQAASPAFATQTAQRNPAPASLAQASAGQPQVAAQPAAASRGEAHLEEEPARSGVVRQVITALAVVAIIGGAAYGIVTFKDPVMRLMSGPAKKVDTAGAPATAPQAPAQPQPETAALPENDPAGPDASQIAGSAIDAQLQKAPLWSMLKKDYPDWYIGSVAAAEKLTADKKPASEVHTQLMQSLVNLRRQKATQALAASPEKLKAVASTFLENLRALQSQSVGACYGFISKGEMSPAVIEMMQAPENATALNAQLAAIFDAASEGAKAPVKHESAGKADYDILIAELSKLGWKEEDLQVFSNPRLLAKREPAQVCKMVQDWFSAHLAVQDAAAQDRLLYETLKPVVSG